MNTRKTVVIVAVIIIALMGLFPPWWYTNGVLAGNRSAGYAWLFTPPSSYTVPDVLRLLVQWAIVAILAWGIAYVLEPKRTP